MNHLPHLASCRPAGNINRVMPQPMDGAAAVIEPTRLHREVITGPIHLPTVGLNTRQHDLELSGRREVGQREIQAILDNYASGYNGLRLRSLSPGTFKTFVSLDFSKCPQMHVIDLPRTATLTHLTGLENCHQLKELQAGGKKGECQSFDNETRASLQKLTSLLLLGLQNNDMTAEEIATIIQNNPNLHQILLGDRAKVHAVLERIKYLDLGGREYAAMYKDAESCDIRLIIRPSNADNQLAYLSDEAWELIQNVATKESSDLTAPELNGLTGHDEDVGTLVFNYGNRFSSLDFAGCTYRQMFTWFDASHLVNIVILNLSGMENLVDLTGLAACNRLQILCLSNCKSLSANSRDAVTETKELREIYLDGAPFDSREILRIVRHNQSLGTVVLDRDSDWREIQDNLNGPLYEGGADPDPAEGIAPWEAMEVTGTGESLELYKSQRPTQ